MYFDFWLTTSDFRLEIWDMRYETVIPDFILQTSHRFQTQYFGFQTLEKKTSVSRHGTWDFSCYGCESTCCLTTVHLLRLSTCVSRLEIWNFQFAILLGKPIECSELRKFQTVIPFGRKSFLEDVTMSPLLHCRIIQHELVSSMNVFWWPESGNTREQVECFVSPKCNSTSRL